METMWRQNPKAKAEGHETGRPPATTAMFGWVARKVTRGFKFRKRSKAVSINLQEIYLRDDIPCGSAACRTCTQISPRLPGNVSHYLVPDADALLRFWEVLELPQVIAVIYLASVMREVQIRSNQRSWRRLRLLFSEKRQHNYYYDDEHCIYTWLSCMESAKGGVECVAEWLYEHLEGAMPIVMLTGSMLSPLDKQDYKLAKHFEKHMSFGPFRETKTVTVLNAEEYFGHYWVNDTSVIELCNSLIQSQIDTNNACDKVEDAMSNEQFGAHFHKEFIYKEHLSVNAIEEGIATGDLRIGVFHASKHNPMEGFVRPSNKGEASLLEILVLGRRLQNRALHGDLVAVRVMMCGQREKQKLIGLDDDFAAGNTLNLAETEGAGYDPDERIHIIEDDDEDDENCSVTGKEGVIMGEIVGIVQRAQRDYVACLDENEEATISHVDPRRQEHLLCIPMDQRIPLVRVASRQRSRLVGQRFVIRVEGWEISSRIPRGHLVRVLGPIGDINAENMALLVENDINISPFSSASLQELPEDSSEHPWVIPEEEFTKRRDLRFSHRSFSIDPPGSKDVDDVLSICELPNNFLEVGVHIADVSYFVKQDSLLDLEARTRGTTVYLVENTYHMLPSILSENLCSLRGGHDRLAVSVIWTVDPENDFEVLNTWFGRTIIRSRYQMFYAQAQAILDNRPLCEGWEIDASLEDLTQLQADLNNLSTFAQARRSLRESQGALELSSVELGFDVDEGGEVVHVNTKHELPMNWIVAEMMIFANSCVARHIHESFPYAALLRRHRPPKLDNFCLLLELCDARGFKLDVSSNKALAASINHIRDGDDPMLESAFKVLAARAMSEAEYVSTGDVSDSSGFYHYGLALEFYTHFTSPIRRYADIIVHRMLVASCSTNTPNEWSADQNNICPTNIRHIYRPDDLKEVADHLNQRHRASKRAQKQCNELHLLMYLQKHAKAEYALVIGILQRGLIVFVPKYDLRGVAHLQDKNGNVILPLDKDEPTSEAYSYDAGRNEIQKFKLQYQPQCISIHDSFGNILYEYKLMAPIWVRLRADGSRARSPTLRVQLLSENHPATVVAQKEHALLLNSISVTSKLKRPMVPSHMRQNQTSAKSERKKAILAMAELAAMGRASVDTFGRNKAKLEQPIMKSTIHDAMRDVEKLVYQVTSLYANFKDGELEDQYKEGFPNIEPSVSNDLDNKFLGRPMLINVSLENSSVKSEEEKKALLRKLWQKRLSQAAEHRSRHLRSRASDEEEKQKRRMFKEQKAREQAGRVGEYVRLVKCQE